MAVVATHDSVCSSPVDDMLASQYVQLLPRICRLDEACSSADWQKWTSCCIRFDGKHAIDTTEKHCVRLDHAGPAIVRGPRWQASRHMTGCVSVRRPYIQNTRVP